MARRTYNCFPVFYPSRVFEEEDRFLVESVARGEKLSCSIIFSEEAYTFSVDRGLFVRRGWNACYYALPDPELSELNISRHEKCCTIPVLEWLKEYFHDLPEIIRITSELFTGLKDWYIADALAFCAAYPRVDDFGKPVSDDNRERPEIATLQGFLFGYKPCCVRYVVGHIHANEPGHQYRKPITSRLWGFLCESCARQAIEDEKYHHQVRK